MKNRICHTLLLLLLLPQLLMLGMGKSFVVCVSAQGHVKVELVASSCCDTPSMAPLDETVATHGNDRHRSSECGSCNDYSLAVNTVVSPKAGDFEVATTPASQFAIWEPSFQDELGLEIGENHRTPEGETAHLTCLRCVVLLT